MILNATKNLLDFSLIRKAFPLIEKHGGKLIYFDSAATCQKPRAVIDAEALFNQEAYGTVHRAIYRLAQQSTEKYNEARLKVQQLLNAESSDEIIFTSGTTHSINLVATSFGKQFFMEQDEILVSELEHHSNIVPWQMIAKEQGAILRVIPVTDSGEIDLAIYKKLLNCRTKLVAIAHVANSIGSCHPIKEMVALAHSHGAKVLVDGAQAISHMPVDVQDLDADFYAFSGHKCYGPTGIGVLYGKKALLNAMPPYQGGGDMIDRVSFTETTYQALPLKFEAGTPKISQAIGLAAAIDFMHSIGLQKIYDYEQILLDYATERLQKLPRVRLIGTASHKSAIISFVVEGAHPLDVGTFLDLKNIAVRTGHHCAQPAMARFKVPATVRASFAVYNTFEEIDLFIDALEAIISDYLT